MEPLSEEQSLFAADKKLTFLLLCLATYALLYIKIAFIENETAAFQFLEDRPEGALFQLLNTLRVVSVPLVYLWKFTVIGFVIWVGCFMYGYRVSFSQCWSIAIVAEYVFLVPEIVKIGWFMFVDTDPTYDEVRGFYPLSLMNFFNYYEMDKSYAYPLRALNLFEILYWFVLVTGVHFFARKQKKIAWLIVSCSYILLFLLWIWFYILVYN
ncbi:MAG TPA: hypothetical protein VIT44_19305 [Cyclobacteriaceae bacterium]